MNNAYDSLPLQFQGSSGYRKYETVLTSRQLNMIDKLETVGKEYISTKSIGDCKTKKFQVAQHHVHGYLKSTAAADMKLKESFNKSAILSENQDLLKFRETLPVHKYKDKVLQLIHHNQVLVLSGETGCGKTTQVPQFILDEAIQTGVGSSVRIICTQPRRVAAISIAERVAKERGDTIGNSVGYQVRLNSAPPRAMGSILYCTSGVLLQRIQSDRYLQQFSHIILDEVHERDAMTDISIVFLNRILLERPEVKVILMSATVNSDQFSKYFHDCPILHIPGFMHPVESYYLQDVMKLMNYSYFLESTVDGDKSNEMFKEVTEAREAEKLEMFENFQINIIASLVSYIHRNEDEGAILVFLPGWEDLCKLNQLLTEHCVQDLDVLLLHGSMSQDDQKLVFKPSSPDTRKVIISTNIAESSLSIEDVVFVIDSGKAKMKMFDVERNLATLNPEWISKANCIQRKGRAGRLQNGKVFKIYSEERELSMKEFMIPEIVRMRLENVVLKIKFLNFMELEDFLQQLMDSPDPLALKLALETLVDIQALSSSGELTPMGEILANIPIDPQLGKMMVLASMLSCLEPVLTIVSALEYKSPFYLTKGRDTLNGIDKLAADTFSDHLTIANAVAVWYCARLSRKNPGCENLHVEFCRDHCLNQAILRNIEKMKIQFGIELHKLGLIPSKDIMDGRVNENSSSEAVVRAVITLGLLPNLVNLQIEGETHSLLNISGQVMEFHPKSVNRDVFNYSTSKMRAPYIPRWFVYFEKIHTTKTFLVDTTSTGPLILLLFAGNLKMGTLENPHRDSSPGSVTCQRLDVESHTSHGEISEIRFIAGTGSMRLLVCQTDIAKKLKFVRSVINDALQEKAGFSSRGKTPEEKKMLEKVLSLVIRVINADV